MNTPGRGSPLQRRPPAWVMRALALACVITAWWSAAACRDSASNPSSTVFQGGSPGGQAATAAGRGLLLVRGEQLLVRDMTTGQERVLKSAPTGAYYGYPRWAPDGMQFAYVVTTSPTTKVGQDWGSDVMVRRWDGSNERIVVRHSRAGDGIVGIAWSADGTALYVSTLSSLSSEPISGQASTSRLLLERVDVTEGRRTTIAVDAAYPTSAPDGSRIAVLTYGNGGQPGGLWTARPDGSDRVLRIPVGPAHQIAGVRAPQFAPDSRRIAFGAVEPAGANGVAAACQRGFHGPWEPPVAEAHGPPIDLWLSAVDSGQPMKVAELGGDDPWVAWSPDGSSVAVLDACRLIILDAAGGNVQVLGAGAAQAQIDWR